MTLKARLESDVKTAMRSGDTLRRSVIRLLKSEVHNQEIADQKPTSSDQFDRLRFPVGNFKDVGEIEVRQQPVQGPEQPEQ